MTIIDGIQPMSLREEFSDPPLEMKYWLLGKNLKWERYPQSSVMPPWCLFLSRSSDLSLYDNWRGISLLDVMGKLFARVINDRLYVFMLICQI